MKVLYLPNEPVEGWQVGARSAFARLHERGKLSELNIYSFLQKPPRVALEEILALAARVQPDAVIFAKIGEFPVDDRWLSALRAVPGRPLIAYYDGDGYGRIFKRVTTEMKALCRHSDIVFLCGLGGFARLFEHAGARRIRYLPNNASLTQFGEPWTPPDRRRFDAVLIGNRIRGRFELQERIPWARMPGVFDREELVRRLGEAFGDRFAVFGAGWDGFVGNQGSIPFARQHEALHESWLSVGYTHFASTPYYFSDRLPIALLSGVAHVVHYHPGYDVMFQNGRDLLWAADHDALIDTIRHALSRGPGYLNGLGACGREYALQHLLSEVVYERMIDTIASLRGDSRR